MPRIVAERRVEAPGELTAVRKLACNQEAHGAAFHSTPNSETNTAAPLPWTVRSGTPSPRVTRRRASLHGVYEAVPYFLRNRSMRPWVSIRRCLPV